MFRDDRRGIAMCYLFCERLWFLAAPGVFQKIIDIVQPRTRKHALIADVSIPCDQITEQLDFEFGSRRKILVAAL